MMALNNKYEFVARGDQSYAVVGAQASSNNKNSTTPFYDIQGENGLMKTGDFFVQIHQIGSGAVIALTRLGDVWFKGYNTQGWAGNGHTTDCYGWVKIPYLGPDASVSSKSCRIIGLTTSQHINGGNYDNITIYAIDSSYRLWTWGYNGNGECGIGNTTSPQTTPQLVTAITNCRMVAAGIYHVMAVDNTGQLYTWGHNAQGQLGTGNTTAYTSPQLIPGATNVYDIATSSGTYYSAGWNYYYHSYYLTNDGRLYGSGYNSYGELGNGNTTNQSSFTRCNPSLTFSDFVLSGSPVYQSIMALGGTPGSNSGLLYGWGYNGNGQTGNGTTTATQSSAVRPDTLCDTTRNRVKSYVNGVMSDSSRPFPRDNITKIAPIAYSESGSGFFVWDNYNRMYIIGYGYQMGTYRTDQSGIAYSRPVLMPSPWSGESGNATPYSYDIIAYNTEGYLYSAGVYNAKMQTSDGRIWWMGSQSDGEYTNDGNFSGRWQQWGM
jgi:alpha-tubulin suppressor-like RCC1 family protein